MEGLNLTTMEVVFKEAQERKPSKKTEVLDALMLAGAQGILNTTLSNISLRYGTLTNALQLDGYDITLENLGNGLIRYTLNSEEKAEKTVVKKGLDIVKNEIKHNYQGVVFFDELVKILDEHNLHIKHKPNGIKKSTLKHN